MNPKYIPGPNVEPVKLKDKSFLKTLKTLGYEVEEKVLWDEHTGKYYETVMALKRIGGYNIRVDCVPSEKGDTCHITAFPTAAPTIYTKTEPGTLDVLLLRIEEDVKDYDHVFFKEYVCKH